MVQRPLWYLGSKVNFIMGHPVYLLSLVLNITQSCLIVFKGIENSGQEVAQLGPDFQKNFYVVVRPP